MNLKSKDIMNSEFKIYSDYCLSEETILRENKKLRNIYLSDHPDLELYKELSKYEDLHSINGYNGIAGTYLYVNQLEQLIVFYLLDGFEMEREFFCKLMNKLHFYREKDSCPDLWEIKNIFDTYNIKPKTKLKVY